MKTFIRKVVKWIAIAAIVLFIIYAGTTRSEFGQNLAVILAIGIIGIPAGIVLFIQICFWVYNAIVHGDPLYDKAVRDEMRDRKNDGQRGFISLSMYSRDNRKVCPVHKVKDNCRFSKRGAAIQYHING